VYVSRQLTKKDSDGLRFWPIGQNRDYFPTEKVNRKSFRKSFSRVTILFLSFHVKYSSKENLSKIKKRERDHVKELRPRSFFFLNVRTFFITGKTYPKGLQRLEPTTQSRVSKIITRPIGETNKARRQR